MTTKDNHMNRTALIVAAAAVAIVSIVYLAPSRAGTPTFVSPQFKECRATAFEHHELCVSKWYAAREKECAEALTGEVKICGEVYPPVLSNGTPP